MSQKYLHCTQAYRHPDFVAVLMRPPQRVGRPSSTYCRASINTATKARRYDDCFACS